MGIAGIAKGIGWSGAINGGIGLWQGMDTYQEKREQGNGRIVSAASGAYEAALPMMMGGWAYAGYSVLTGVPEMLHEGWKTAEQYRRQLQQESRGHAFNNAKFNDTQQAYTMRQAGMAIAQRSRYNINQAMLGNEAKYMAK